MKKPYVILFAGPVGSSKSTIAHYLSWNLGLPIFCNDSVRRETVLEKGELDEFAYLERRNTYLKKIIDSSKNFIFDASVDRSWEELRERLVENRYDYFIISIDVSKIFLKKLTEGYDYNVNNTDTNFSEHQKFLNKNKKLINLSINDTNFEQRLDITLVAIKNFIKKVK